MDVDIEEIVGVNVKKIQTALTELREHDFKEYKEKLPILGRCTICTLRVPCKHFTTVHQIPRTQTPLLSPGCKSTGFNTMDYLPKLTPESNKRGFSVRYRGRSTVYNFDFNSRNTTLPNEKRLKQLEAIESYREEKLTKEMEKIQTLKKEEEKKKKEEKEAEEAWKQYLKKQKKKLKEYQDSLNLRRKKIREIFEMESLKQKQEEEKRKRYAEEQKIKLHEYNEKKKLLEKISRQKILDLEDEVIHHKPIKIRHYNEINKKA